MKWILAWKRRRAIFASLRRHVAEGISNRSGFRYGDDKTIHGTREVNVERDPDTGEVVAVWFRCMLLPFTDHVVEAERAEEMGRAYHTRPKGIIAIEFSSEPAPEEYELRGMGLHPKRKP